RDVVEAIGSLRRDEVDLVDVVRVTAGNVLDGRDLDRIEAGIGNRVDVLQRDRDRIDGPAEGHGHADHGFGRERAGGDQGGRGHVRAGHRIDGVGVKSVAVRHDDLVVEANGEGAAAEGGGHQHVASVRRGRLAVERVDVAERQVQAGDVGVGKQATVL